MPNKTPNNDSFFRGSMINIEVATAAFHELLPEPLRQLVDFSSLNVENVSFVDPQHRNYIVDILYSVKIDTQPGYIYLLTEQQSQPDWLMPYRIYQYLGAIFDYDLNRQAQHPKKLPIVIPLVIYNGNRSPYPYSMDIFDLFQQPNLAREYMFRTPILKDLTVISDDELLQQKTAAMMYMIGKHVHDRDVLPTVKRLVEAGILQYVQTIGSGQYLSFVLNYIIEKGEVSNEQQLFDLLFQELPEHRGEIMTIAQWLEQKGIRQGIEQGIEKGIEQGIEQGAVQEKLAIAAKMRAHGIATNVIHDVTGLSLEKIKTLH